MELTDTKFATKTQYVQLLKICVQKQLTSTAINFILIIYLEAKYK